LEYLGLTQEATDVRNAVNAVINAGIGTPDLNPREVIGCEAFGEKISNLIK
jgi:isocitrate/isopropylmalate dehydrogenase